MLYSSAGLLALIIQLIINHDVLWKGSSDRIIPARRAYRAFLLSVSFYYVTDILWGLLYERGLIRLTFIDTALYFLAMAFSILFWTQYVIRYLKEKNAFGRLLNVTGWLLFIFQLAMLPANFFVPVLYSFDASGAYCAEVGRYATLAIQIIMFLWTGIYAFVISARSEGTMRLRYRTVGLSSVAMAASVIAQACFPLLPMYAIGCMLSTCFLHAFVLENEKEEYRDRLEAQLQDSILKGNYYDLLTGLPGMSYFFEQAQRHRDGRSGGDSTPAFLYLNLSGLKFYNQKHGFTAGDALLRDLARLLTDTFGEGACSRLGQDHFAAFTVENGLKEALDALFDTWSGQRDRPAILVGVYLDRDGSQFNNPHLLRGLLRRRHVPERGKGPAHHLPPGPGHRRGLDQGLLPAHRARHERPGLRGGGAGAVDRPGAGLPLPGGLHPRARAVQPHLQTGSACGGPGA